MYGTCGSSASYGMSVIISNMTSSEISKIISGIYTESHYEPHLKRCGSLFISYAMCGSCGRPLALDFSIFSSVFAKYIITKNSVILIVGRFFMDRYNDFYFTFTYVHT